MEDIQPKSFVQTSLVARNERASTADKATKSRPTSSSRQKASFEKHVQRQRANSISSNSNVLKTKPTPQKAQTSSEKPKTTKQVPVDLEIVEEQDNIGPSLGNLFKMLTPHTLMHQIFARLDIPDKKTARLVCKLWLELMNPLLKWNVSLRDENAEQFVEFFRSGKFSESLTILKLKQFEYPAEGICSLAKIHTLKFSPAEGIKSSNFKAIMNDCKTVSRLDINSKCFPGANKLAMTNFECVKILKLEQLAELNLITYTSDALGFKICSQLLTSAHFPNLARFHIVVDYPIEEFVEPPPLYVETYKFAAAHSPSLQKLIITHTGAVAKQVPYKLSNYAANYSISEEDFDQVLSSLDKLSLDEFHVAVSLYEGVGKYTFGITLINFQNNLNTLAITELHRSNMEVWYAAERLILRSKGTLKTILVAGCICPPAEQDVLSLSTFTSFSHLEELQLHLCGLKLSDIGGLPMRIKTLNLGPDLSEEEMITISDNMLNLEKLYLMQRNAKYPGISVPKVSVETFKMMIKKLPCLKRIILMRECCQWRLIWGLICNTEGLNAYENSEVDIGKAHIGVFIDREEIPKSFFESL